MTNIILDIVHSLTSIYIAESITMSPYDFGYKYYGDNECPYPFNIEVTLCSEWLQGRNQARIDNNYKELNYEGIK